MSLTAAQIREHFSISLATDAIQRLIVNVESEISQVIGPEGTEIEISINEDGNYLYVNREVSKNNEGVYQIESIVQGIPPQTVETDDVTVIDNGYTIFKAIPWKPPITLVYTAMDDGNIRDKATLDLIQLEFLRRGIVRESDGEYQVQQFDIEEQREAVLQRLRARDHLVI